MRLAWRSLLGLARRALDRALSREDFGHVQHLRLVVAPPAQPAFDVQHAAEVAEHHGVGAGGRDVAALVVGETRRNLAELDRERAAEAAAVFAFGHFPEG